MNCSGTFCQLQAPPGTLALLRSKCNGIESEQGSGSEGDAVPYNTWLLCNINIFFRFGVEEGSEGRDWEWEGNREEGNRE